jgi:hypothetical protein
VPRACPVEAHAGGYRRHSFFPRCHGLVQWRLTLVATAATAFFLDATGLSRGGSRSWLPPPQLFSSMPRACPVEAHARGYRRHSFFPRCHGLVPWRLTLVATAATAFFLDATALSRGGSRSWLPPPQLFSSMPRACPVEAHARGYRRHSFFPRTVAATVKLHGTSPWPPGERPPVVAASVTLHTPKTAARPWHLVG